MQQKHSKNAQPQKQLPPDIEQLLIKETAKVHRERMAKYWESMGGRPVLPPGVEETLMGLG